MVKFPSFLGPHRDTPCCQRKKVGRESMASLDKIRQPWKTAWDWLVWRISVDYGAQALSLMAWSAQYRLDLCTDLVIGGAEWIHTESKKAQDASIIFLSPHEAFSSTSWIIQCAIDWIRESNDPKIQEERSSPSRGSWYSGKTDSLLHLLNVWHTLGTC